jgi:hypothetical protein
VCGGKKEEFAVRSRRVYMEQISTKTLPEWLRGASPLIPCCLPSNARLSTATICFTACCIRVCSLFLLYRPAWATRNLVAQHQKPPGHALLRM